MVELYDDISLRCSKLVTKSYSTSFSMGIRLFDKKFRSPIYSIYGFVRFADEIVDTFHNHNKKELLDKFRKDTFEAIEEKLSLNPILHSFQDVANKYHINKELIDAFLNSMEMDLHKTSYQEKAYKDYIYGSAEAVGLMCLKVFTEGNHEQYDSLEDSAKSLGAAFQKINFLRDIKSDYDERGRIYFPNVDYNSFTEAQKKEIEEDIDQDFKDALVGIKRLPQGSQLGVYVSYLYFYTLLNKISNSPIAQVKEERIRVKNRYKLFLLAKSTVKHKLNLL